MQCLTVDTLKGVNLLKPRSLAKEETFSIDGTYLIYYI